VLTARSFVAEARIRGLEARFSCDKFFAAPFTDHRYAEFHVDGQSVPVDPYLLNTTTRLGLLSGDLWPPYRSLSDAHGGSTRTTIR
jgi:hypothetical protein